MEKFEEYKNNAIRFLTRPLSVCIELLAISGLMLALARGQYLDKINGFHCVQNPPAYTGVTSKALLRIQAIYVKENFLGKQSVLVYVASDNPDAMSSEKPTILGWLPMQGFDQAPYPDSGAGSSTESAYGDNNGVALISANSNKVCHPLHNSPNLVINDGDISLSQDR